MKSESEKKDKATEKNDSLVSEVIAGSFTFDDPSKNNNKVSEKHGSVLQMLMIVKSI